jgi:predicted aminopeptidase
VLVGVGLAVASCSTVGYYAQAARGGLEILGKRRSIERLLARPHLDPALRSRLVLVQRMRDFASRELGLPDNRSYRSYAALGRPAVSWTVVAAPALSLEPKLWCFPVAGCVSYRGYFDPAAAERYGRELEAQGYDVEVGGVAAFSSLGWFADPVLDTFLGRPDADLAGLLFHELAHQVAYAPSDTTFNESFATVVERVGVERWLEAEGRLAEIAALRTERAREAQALDLLATARAELQALYRSALEDAAKRRRKGEILDQARAAHARLAEAWGGSPYAGWFDAGLDNARLVSFGAYHERVPCFEALLEEEGGDLSSFYARVRVLAARTPKDPC